MRTSIKIPSSRDARVRFERMYRNHAAFVWAAAQQCGVPSGSIEDVVQDVFVTAYRRMNDLKWEISPRGWLYGITRRIAFRHRRTEARASRRIMAASLMVGRHVHADSDVEVSHEFESLISKLSPGQRKLFILSEVLGMTGPEIAAEMCVPLNTVYSRIRSVRRRLEALADGYVSDSWSGGKRSKPSKREVQACWIAIGPRLEGDLSMLLRVAVKKTMASYIKVVPLVVVAVAVWVAVATGGDFKDVRPEHVSSRVVSPENEKVSKGEVVGTQPVEAKGDLSPIGYSVDVGRAIPTLYHPLSSGRRKRKFRKELISESGLEQEAILIEKAQALMLRGNVEDAMSVIMEHERRFPKGALLDARKAIRVRLMCRDGRVEDAEREAAELAAQRPRSLVATSASNKCRAFESR